MRSPLPRTKKLMRQRRLNHCWLLWNERLRPEIQPWHFDRQLLQQQGASATAGGRGGSLFATVDGQQWVVRHYCRGGLIGRLIADRYLFTGLTHSRVYREFQLLEQMLALGLPVPQPVAGRLCRHGPLATADLITLRVTAAEDLVALLQQRPLTAAEWQALGQLLARFHRHGICHADLNLRNILLDEQGQFYLIDFDRGQQRQPAQRWQQANLQRLLRSCRKELAKDPNLHFSAACWQQLLAGYHG